MRGAEDAGPSRRVPYASHGRRRGRRGPLFFRDKTWFREWLYLMLGPFWSSACSTSGSPDSSWGGEGLTGCHEVPTSASPEVGVFNRLRTKGWGTVRACQGATTLDEVMGMKELRPRPSRRPSGAGACPRPRSLPFSERGEPSLVQRLFYVGGPDASTLPEMYANQRLALNSIRVTSRSVRRGRPTRPSSSCSI